MKRILLFLCVVVVSQIIFGQDQKVLITGTVTDGLKPISDVNISIVGTKDGTKTDMYGKYVLQTTEGKVLKYSHIGYSDIEIQVEDIDRTLNVTMYYNVEQLDDVTITQKRKLKKSQKELFNEYNTNPDLIKTQFGILDKKIAGHAMYIVARSQIKSDGRNVFDDLNGLFPIRNNIGSLSYQGAIAVEIDGMIFNPPPSIPPDNIERVAYIPGLGGVSLYGSIARNGILIINTRSGNFSPKGGSKKGYNTALVRGNNFENDAFRYDILNENMPTYLLDLNSSKNIEEAKGIYLEKEKLYGSSFHFVLDAYQYFFEQDKNSKFADIILNEKKELFEKNAIALKALAYIYEMQRRTKKAHSTYKDLFILRPNYGQSYIDLANSYREIGQIEKAMAMYLRYDFLLNKGLVFPDKYFDNIMDREYNNLLTFEGGKLFRESVQKSLLNNEAFNTRLIFEWSDSEAEFELQFVNPEGKYFKIENSLLANPERISSQKIAGYTMEEHLIDSSLPGKWQINAKYLGNKSLTPTYMKVTIYSDYGRTTQRKKVKVFRLSLKNVNQELFELYNTSKISN